MLDPLDHARQAGEHIDEAQDDDPVTDSDPEVVKIVQYRIIGLDQAAGDQDQPYDELDHGVVDEAPQRQCEP